jgi:hypothetical protein
MTIGNILRPFGILYGRFGIVLLPFGIFSPVLVCFDQDESGSPAHDSLFRLRAKFLIEKMEKEK